MNEKTSGRDVLQPVKRPRPVLGVICVAFSALGTIAPIIAGKLLGLPYIDVYLRNFVPVVGPVLAVLSFTRRERAVWGIVGIVLSAFYIGLHLLAIP
jgi:hypothetical protein